MNAATLMETIKTILIFTLPYLKQLIESKVIPALKRKKYEKVDVKIDNLISDLAQNAGKIQDEENVIKKEAYLEGTKLGISMLRAIAEKLNKAADEIEKAVNQ